MTTTEHGLAWGVVLVMLLLAHVGCRSPVSRNRVGMMARPAVQHRGGREALQGQREQQQQHQCGTPAKAHRASVGCLHQ